MFSICYVALKMSGTLYLSIDKYLEFISFFLFLFCFVFFFLWGVKGMQMFLITHVLCKQLMLFRTFDAHVAFYILLMILILDSFELI